jgi:hypothetical protein
LLTLKTPRFAGTNVGLMALTVSSPADSQRLLPLQTGPSTHTHSKLTGRTFDIAGDSNRKATGDAVQCGRP